MTPEEIQAAELACGRLVNEYCYAVDDCDVDRFVGVFTDDGVWQRDAQLIFSGREQLRAFFVSRRENVVTMHVCSNLRVNVIDAQRAEGRSYLTVFRSDRSADPQRMPPALPELVAECFDNYQRTAAGWRIARRVTTLRFRRDATPAESGREKD